MRPMKSALLAGGAILIGAVPAMATDNATDKQKQQYLYDQTLKNEGAAAGQQAPAANSGPGVQGPADTRTGPATRAPGGSSADANPGSSSSGSSSGEAGSAGNTATPSQDSSGVQGPPDTRTGPSTRTPQ